MSYDLQVFMKTGQSKNVNDFCHVAQKTNTQINKDKKST